MNKKLPFEEAFERKLDDLPAGNEDESWQKMKQLLDDNERRKPLAYFKSYKVLFALLFLLTAGLWFINESGNTSDEKPSAAAEHKAVPDQQIVKSPLENATNKSQSKPVLHTEIPSPVDSNNAPLPASTTTFSTNQTLSKQEIKRIVVRKKSDAFISKLMAKRNQNQQYNLQGHKAILSTRKADSIINRDQILAGNSQSNSSKSLTDIEKSKKQSDTVAAMQNDQQQQLNHSDTSSSSIAVKAAPGIKDTAVTASRQPVKRPGKYVVTAGVGAQQQVPVAGQQSVHYGYNANGRLSDYIPVVYLQLEKEGKWFLQTGFSYGTPQLVKEFAYSRKTIPDTSNAYTTTTLRLKKTFYSQVPISFNYYIYPGWSVGVGGMYSWLHGAIAEKETVTQNVQTQAKSVVKEIVPIAGYTDSFLYRSHTYLLLQSAYNWRRFSLGMRYAKDVQPYIKYTLPDGSVTNQKNWSLEFILRFRLWRSPRF